MKTFFIGDINGEPGRKIVSKLLPDFLSKNNIEACIANCENAAAGFGVTKDIVEFLFKQGIDVLTSGNHIWDKKDVMNFIDDSKYNLLRPSNYPDEAPGRGSIVIKTKSGINVGVINISGRIFVDYIDCPFKALDKEIARITPHTNIIIVDIHAEATSEKMALGWYADGKVSAILGTHTHVQTADERVLPHGTAYITDAGMTGPRDSVIGIKREIAIEKFITKVPKKFDVAGGVKQLNGVIIEVDDSTGKANSIERVQLFDD